MKRLLPIVLIALTLIYSCKKVDYDLPKSDKFKIDSIIISGAVAAGQRIDFISKLSDTIGDIQYEWVLLNAGKQEGTSIIGRLLKDVKFNPKNIGEYSIKLTITKGANNSATLEKKFTVKKPSFGYGVWGDSELLVTSSELDNGGIEYGFIADIPAIKQNNAGLKIRTYKKGDALISYYFSGGKLIAGAKTLTLPSKPGGFNWHGLYTTERDLVSKDLTASPIEEINWSIPDSQKTPYLSVPIGVSLAVENNYAQLISNWQSESTLAKLSMEYKPSSLVYLTTVYKSSAN